MQFTVVISAVLLAGELILLLLAWKTWITRVHPELPPWRNAACCVALLLLSLEWCGGASLGVLLFGIRTDSAAETLIQIMLPLSRPLDIVAIVFAVALKRSARVEAVIAGLLMFAGWPFGYA
jgi:hypothetical protein